MTNKNKYKFLIYLILCISLVLLIPWTNPPTVDSAQEIIPPQTSALTEKRAFAIVIGVEDYPGSSNDLNYCSDDSNSINSRLYNDYGFDDIVVHLLVDLAATKDAIVDAFNMISFIIKSDDIFFFYFSGHGGKGSFTNYICPYDSMADNSKRIYDTDLNNYLDWVSCSEQYIIIDSCGSGGMIDEAQGPNRYFMTACEKTEDSWETSALGHGVFTYYFLRSFTQASDSNGDGVISMEEQYSYTNSRTVSYSTGLGDVQHPQEYDGISGESVFDTKVGSLTFILNGTRLDYSFFLYGHGSISTIQITLCSVAENTTIEAFNLIPDAPSSTGFGFYSGNVSIGGFNNITGYKIRIVVYWYNHPPGSPKIIQYLFGDADGDNLTDFFEIDNGLNPRVKDTDWDGLDDYFEFYGVTDPLLNDTDGDGMLDGFEVFSGLDPLTNDTGLDLDGDGLTNGIECQCGSLANNSDSDNDLMPDKWEYDNNLNLNTADDYEDPDEDGLTNLEEYDSNTNPHLEDTDGDTWNDGDEIAQGTDPLDPDDHPQPPSTIEPPSTIAGFAFFSLIAVIFVSVLIYFRKRSLNITQGSK
ncbi:MAG: caspase family protein [Candidatus Lokiarchaeota archaeon]|nr:caspase family protein [Candidatus Lokiarchaeota archaeon]